MHLVCKDAKFYGEPEERKPINFLGKKKDLLYHFHCTDHYADWLTMGIHSPQAGNGALNYSLEFKGGTSTNVTFNEDMSHRRYRFRR